MSYVMSEESIEMPTSKKSKKKHSRPGPVPLGLFTGFAIPISIVAMSMNTFLGILLAAYLAYLWTRVAGIQEGAPIEDAVDALSHKMGRHAPIKSSGNASFDAYREELLQRLEQEQASFEDFLTRLRTAKDKTEFDDFMEKRAEAAKHSG